MTKGAMTKFALAKYIAKKHKIKATAAAKIITGLTEIGIKQVKEQGHFVSQTFSE